MSVLSVKFSFAAVTLRLLLLLVQPTAMLVFYCSCLERDYCYHWTSLVYVGLRILKVVACATVRACSCDSSCCLFGVSGRLLIIVTTMAGHSSMCRLCNDTGRDYAEYCITRCQHELARVFAAS